MSQIPWSTRRWSTTCTHRRLKEWGGEHAIDRDAFEAYAECLRSPEIVRTMCEDYRAGDRIDIAHEQVDRVRGRHVSGAGYAMVQ